MLRKFLLVCLLLKLGTIHLFYLLVTANTIRRRESQKVLHLFLVSCTNDIVLLPRFGTYERKNNTRIMSINNKWEEKGLRTYI